MTTDARVYHLYNQHGRVLYIGCTTNLPRRLAEHRRNLRMGYRIARVAVSDPMPKREALAVERAAIEAEQPEFNIEWTVRHKRGYSPTKRRSA